MPAETRVFVDFVGVAFKRRQRLDKMCRRPRVKALTRLRHSLCDMSETSGHCHFRTYTVTSDNVVTLISLRTFARRDCELAPKVETPGPIGGSKRTTLQANS